MDFILQVILMQLILIDVLLAIYQRFYFVLQNCYCCILVFQNAKSIGIQVDMGPKYVEAKTEKENQIEKGSYQKK